MKEDHINEQHVTWNFNTEDHVDRWHVTGNIIIEDHNDECHVINIIIVQQQSKVSKFAGKLNIIKRQDHRIINIEKLINDWLGEAVWPLTANSWSLTFSRRLIII